MSKPEHERSPAEPDSAEPGSSERDDAQLPDFVSFLPEQVYYLTQSGREMWCRRPYGFFFSTSEAATAFARAMGSQLELMAIGVRAHELVSRQGTDGMRRLGVTRLFIDPSIDAATGEVYGKILRLEPVQ